MSVVLLKSRASLTFGVFRTEQIFWIFDKLRKKFRGSYWRYIRIKPNANGLYYVLFYLFCSSVSCSFQSLIMWTICFAPYLSSHTRWFFFIFCFFIDSKTKQRNGRAWQGTSSSPRCLPKIEKPGNCIFVLWKVYIAFMLKNEL